MPFVTLSFELHQPRRLRHYTFFDIGRKHDYEDLESSRQMVGRLSEKCCLPANALILELIREHGGSFKVSYGISGLFLEQLRKSRKKVFDSFRRLADTGCVEFLGGTYHHSLAFLFAKKEFEDQVRLQCDLIEDLFGEAPVSFQNTGLIYNDDLARALEKIGFHAVLSEGAEKILQGRSPHVLYRPAGCRRIGVLLRNEHLSDDISFRFSDRTWSEYPLTAEKYAGWVHRVKGENTVVNVLVDYETFGGHQWAETGIFEFLKALPREILKNPDFRFSTPAEVVRKVRPAGELSVPDFISWTGKEKDLTAWCGNHLQKDALEALYGLARRVRLKKDKRLTEVWRLLQASDHFYYMGNRWQEAADLTRYLNPYPSPYDAYINFMNVLTDYSNVLKSGVPAIKKKKGGARPASPTGLRKPKK
jgi:alpha-amylase